MARRTVKERRQRERALEPLPVALLRGALPGVAPERALALDLEVLPLAQQRALVVQQPRAAQRLDQLVLQAVQRALPIPRRPGTPRAQAGRGKTRQS
ncbi:MAG: hypothetical protein ACYDAE_25130 [Steroidobacteraceae bacterium]